ncbi:hypothetical protein [Micromonospora sp. S-DT3-3-22]|uniref:hypothetical protein n=1 Tax=Micromonospora sp. S-DT3-3-22 TaxID=2755359 RepID=UPI00188F13E0|nr:hypothetical protein [Micromonospora sp. S-DT3-3-22]
MLAVVAATIVVVGGIVDPAVAAPLNTTPLITFNMQGSNQGVVWTDTIGGYAGSAEIVLLQEAGPTPPGEARANIPFGPAGLPGRRGYVQHSIWQNQRQEYHIYFLQTDANGGSYVGGRNNMAIVTRRVADEVDVIRNPDGRDVLGVRFGNNWYFTFHGQSNGPGGSNESAAMTQRIANRVNQVAGRQWTVAGDFNMEPGTFAAPAGSYRYNSGQPTHQSGRELDYALSSENVQNLPVIRGPGRGADHYAVQIGVMRAAAQPPDLRIMPLGDSITYGDGGTQGAYRGPLWDELASQEGTNVSYVGSVRSGPIADPDNEGHGGYTIADIAGLTDSALQILNGQVRPMWSVWRCGVGVDRWDEVSRWWWIVRAGAGEA